MIETALSVLLLAVPAVLLVAFTVADVVRRRDLSTPRTVLWLAIVVVLPVIGTLVYLLGRPFALAGKSDAAAGARVTRLLDLLDQRDAGALDDDELHDAVRDMVDDAER